MREKINFAPIWNTHPINFGVVALLNGGLSPETLTEALTKVRQKHPLLGNIIVQDDDGYWITNETDCPFIIREAQGHWQDIVAHEINVPFNMLEAPPLRFILVPAEMQTALIVIIHHGVADGLAATFILRDIFEYVAHPDRPITPMAILPRLDDLIPKRDVTQIDFSAMHAYQPRVHGDENLEDHTRVYVLNTEFTSAQTKTLIDRCRDEKTTVHAALCIAFLLAHEQIEEGDLAPFHVVSSPVNVRNKLSVPIGEQFGAYISPGVITRLDRGETLDFWAKARAMREALIQEVNSDRLYLVSYFFQYVGYMFTHHPELPNPMESSGKCSPFDLSITNVGQVAFDPPIVQIYGPMPNPLSREKILGAATTKHGDQVSLALTLISPYWLMDRPVGERLMALGQGELLKAIAI
jgi:hypothetical protein